MFYNGKKVLIANSDLETRQAKLLESIKEVSEVLYNAEIQQGRGLAISFDDPSKISYTLKDEFLEDDERRIKTTLQKYARRQLNITVETISDHELNNLCNEIMKPFTSSFFKLATGDEIAEAYMNSFGNNSCMTGGTIESTKNLLALYINNPQIVNLAMMKKGNMQARAILWLKESTVYVDRMYMNSRVIEDDFCTVIKSAFSDKDVCFRNHDSLPSDDEFNENITFEIPDNFNSVYPYLDSFRYFEIGNNSIFLSNCKDGMDYQADSTGGGFNDIERNICAHCGEGMGDDDLTYVENVGEVCEYCLDKNYSYCDECDHYFCVEDVNYIDSTGKYICNDCLPNSDYYYCEECEQYFHVDNMHFTDEGDYCNYCHNYKYTTCELCNKEILVDDTQYIDSQSFCDDCYSQLVEVEEVV